MFIFPEPQHMQLEDNEWIFSKYMTLNIPKKYANKSRIALFKEYFKNFTGGTGLLRINQVETDANVAIFSENKSLISERKNSDEEYSIIISKGKATLVFSSEKGFCHAFFTLLKLIEVYGVGKAAEKFTLPVGEIKDSPKTAFRALHLCFFPESSYIRMRKFIRFAGFLGYSHIVVEFWGMFPFKTERAFGRKEAYSVRQIKLLVQDAEDSGVEIIPMLNVFGHATQNQVRNGKHTILERFPKLAPLFESSGWTWNLINPAVYKIQIRLIDELLGCFCKGKYFMIGCDEAYGFATDRQYKDKDKAKILVNHINKIASYLKSRGRTSLMWADMLLSYERFQWTNVNCGLKQELCEKILHGLDREIVLTDWQYWTKEPEMQTSAYLSAHGFKVVIAPWNDKETTMICMHNIEKHEYYGFMQTTWQDIFRDFSLIPFGSINAWGGSEKAEKMNRLEHEVLTVSAKYFRCLMRVKKYKEEGICDYEIEI